MKSFRDDDGAVLILALILLAVSLTLITAVNSLIYNTSNQMSNKSEDVQLDNLIESGLQEEFERLKEGIISPGETTYSLSTGEYTTNVTFLEDGYARIASTAQLEGQSETASITKKLNHTTKDYSIFDLETLMEFDGADYIDVSNIPEVKNNFTIEFWANPNKTIDIFTQSNSGVPEGTSFNKNIIISEKHRGTDAGYIVDGAGVGVSFGQNGLMVVEHSTGFYNFPLTWEDTKNLIDGLTHVAIVYNNWTPKLYINGEYIKTGLQSGKYSANDALPVYAGLSQGKIATGAYGSFQGGIKEVRLWDDIRTETEIEDNGKHDLAGDESNLVAYYKFDNSTQERILTDYANGNDGIVFGPKFNQQLIESLKFANNSYISLDDSIDNALSYNNTNNQTLTILTELKTTQSNGVIYSFDEQKYFELSLVNGKLHFDYSNLSGDVFSRSSSIAIDDGNWHKVAITFEQGEVRFYIDGQLQDEIDQRSKYYKIIAKHSGKALTVSNGETWDGTNVEQWSYNGWGHQQWEISDEKVATAGYYHLIPRHTDKVLDRDYWGDNVQIYSENGGSNQHWAFQITTDNYYKIICRDTGEVLDVAWAGQNNGDNVIVWSDNGNDNQRWKVERTDKYFGNGELQSGYIGVDADSGTKGSDYFQGEIKFLQHWDRILDSSDRESYLNNQPPSSDSDLMACYYADKQNTGQALVDCSNNNQTGKMYDIDVFQDRISHLNFQQSENDYVAISNQSYQGRDYKELTLIAKLKTTDGSGIIYSFDRSEYFRLGISASGNYDHSLPDGRLTFEFATSSGYKDLIWAKDNEHQLDDGQEHIIAVVFKEDPASPNQGLVTMYIDGDLYEISSYNGQSFPHQFGSGVQRYGFIGVGSEADSFDGRRGPSEYFSGRLYWLQHWKKALTESEIEQYSQQLADATDPDLVSLYDPLPQEIIPDLSAFVFAKDNYSAKISGNPKYSASGIWKDNNSASNVVISITDNSQAFGGKVLRAGNKISYYKDKTYSYDSNKIYKIEARVRQLLPASNDQQECSIGVEADGSEYLVTTKQLTTTDGWQILEGYFSGQVANSFIDFNLTTIQGVSQIRPLFKLNAVSGDGTAEIDYLKIEEYQVSN